MDRFEDLVDIMARLRAPGGCPWDREQDHHTLKPYLLEEAYEVLEAIDHGSDVKLCDELGDLLLQIVFHAQLAREEGRFTIGEVTARICEKLRRRHPHVFGEVQVRDSDEVVHNWEAIKRAEPPNADRTSALDGVPAALPALLRATKVQKRAARVGFDWDDAQGPAAKVREELAEVEEAAASGEAERVADEIGDLLFAAVNLARMLEVDSEEALRQAIARFSDRFRAMEEMAEARGVDLHGLSLEQMDEMWEAVKSGG
jgi:MazG family protein